MYCIRRSCFYFFAEDQTEKNHTGVRPMEVLQVPVHLEPLSKSGPDSSASGRYGTEKLLGENRGLTHCSRQHSRILLRYNFFSAADSEKTAVAVPGYTGMKHRKLYILCDDTRGVPILLRAFLFLFFSPRLRGRGRDHTVATSFIPKKTRTLDGR